MNTLLFYYSFHCILTFNRYDYHSLRSCNRLIIRRQDYLRNRLTQDIAYRHFLAVSLWDERVWAAGPGASEGGPSPTAGDVICRDPTAAGDVLAEALRVLTGARSARHTTSEGPGESRFDIYVDNPLLEPGERVVANVTFHVGSGWAAPPDPPATGATPREEAAWLSRALQAGDVGTLLTYDVEGGEDGSACCLRLNGTAGDLWVGIGPSLCEVCALGERVVVAAESLRAELARPSSHDDILYGGPFEGRPRAEVLAVLLELAGTLAGATGVFHDETVEGGRMRWISSSAAPARSCRRDRYGSWRGTTWSS